MLAPRHMLADVAGDWLALVIQNKEWDITEAVIDEMIAQVNDMLKQILMFLQK